MKTFTLLGFIAEIPAIERDVHASGPMVIKRACEIVEKKAKAAIGKNHEMWPPLAESTKRDRVAKGFPEDKPLLRTGELRDSIEHTTSGLEGAVGSNLDRALWLEMGTSKMPPRSFLRSSAISAEDRIRRMAAAATIAALSGHGRHASDVTEMLHLLHRAGDALRELGEDLLHLDDEDEK
ncbi:hypothetical protein [Bradyrhizobium sp. BR 10261]|uniref:hypothetical protein n=1 Tax=Bradyrhizobium sp. BR 10261 TaxID=2749992 RepID=UPI001C65335D|nr:hypothetical protein [Bradyrhizobium sp. BR 10261]MBW7964961.1 hypothetical protein [Bradyrhizobium sp. BR 10261]